MKTLHLSEIGAICTMLFLLQGCDKEKIKERTLVERRPGPTSIAGSIARSEPFRIVEAQGEIDGKTLDDLRTEDIDNSKLGIFTLTDYKQVNAYVVTTWGDETIIVALRNVPVGGEAGDVSVDVQDVIASVSRRGRNVCSDLRRCQGKHTVLLECGPYRIGATGLPARNQDRTRRQAA